MLFLFHKLDHLLSVRRLIHVFTAPSNQVYFALSFELSEYIEIVSFGVHGNVVKMIFDMKRFKPHALGFIGTVFHPYKTA